MLVDPETGTAAQVRLHPGPGGGRRRAAAGGRGRSVRSTSSASTTSRSAGWPSGSRRSGCPSEEDPVILPRSSEGLYLLQRVRDEAHRFAITHHRSRRSKSMVESLLDDVPGLGEVRRRTLRQALRLAEEAACRHRRGDRRGAGHRRRAPPPRSRKRSRRRRPQDWRRRARQHRHGRDRGGLTGGHEEQAQGRTGPSRPARTTERPGGTTGRGARRAGRRHRMTGAGRSTAAKELEDLGWFVVDNLPPELVAEVVRLVDDQKGRGQPIAVVVDVRGGSYFETLREQLATAPAQPAHHPAVPRGRRRHPGAAAGGGAPTAPAAGRRAAARGDRLRARA